MRIGKFGLLRLVLLAFHLVQLVLEVQGASRLGLSGSIQSSDSLVSPGGVFKLGFYRSPTSGRTSSSTSYGLAIWYAQLPISVTAIVWLARRDITLSSKAFLQLSQNGILQLFDPSHAQQPIWESSNTPALNAMELEMRDAGELVLLNATNATVWSSFDTPTDTLLPGQEFSANMNTFLSAWKSVSDWSDGSYIGCWIDNNFTLSWTGDSIPIWNRSSWSGPIAQYGNATVYPYQNTSLVNYALLDPNTGSFYLGNDSTRTLEIRNTSAQVQGILRRVTLDRDGGLRMYSWSLEPSTTSWTVENNWIQQACNVFATCGPFAYCSPDPNFPAVQALCTCPDNFTPIDSTDATMGCKPVYEMPDYCVNTTQLNLTLVGDIDYPYADREYPAVSIDLDSCIQRCLNDCKCAGATYWRQEHTCYIKSSPLFNGGYPQVVGDRTAYLKVLKAPLGRGSHGKKTKLIAGICAAAIIVLLLFGLFIITRYRPRDRKHMSIFSHQLVAGPRKFTYRELSLATKNFHEDERVGSGGFGAVYKGTLQLTGSLVAVKRIAHESRHGEEGFLAEASSLSQIRHRNLVQLQGWCHDDGKLLLVYDFMPNGSLDQWLYGNGDIKSKRRSSKELSWELRYSILAGVAAALAYLHEEWQQCVLHRDIKSSNVLLDSEFNAHLGDFGLARLIDHQKVEKTTLLAGTLGYMAPEMPYTGKATKETDVYSFGILMLEVVCGRYPVDSSGNCEPEDVVLLYRVWRAYETGKLLSVVDPRIECGIAQKIRASESSQTSRGSSSRLASKLTQEQEEEVDYSVALSRRIEQTISLENEEKGLVLKLGLLCCLPNPLLRPAMRLVNQILKSREVTALPPLPASNHMSSVNVLAAARAGFHPQPYMSEQYSFSASISTNSDPHMINQEMP